MNVNTKFKDSVFSSLFSEPARLRELYGALAGVEVPPDTPVEITTLQDAVFKGRINDISFLIASKLVVLIEHQSTINPNMSLRMLLYVARLYEKLIDAQRIYTSKPLKIPSPEFFVLYNGTAPYPDREVLRLSDMFESLEPLGLGKREPPLLDLEVRVFNINAGRNGDILKRVSLLAQYSAFIAKIREYESAGTDRLSAMIKAVQYCLEHDILKEYLEKNASEAINMLITEWDWDAALAVRFEEGMEKGKQEERTYVLDLLSRADSLEEVKRMLTIPHQSAERGK